MTNTKKRYFTSLLSNDNLRIPTREEFHRYASNLLTEGDFCTEHSSGYQVSRVANALDWSKKKAFKVNKGENNGNN
jgi:hypothetical protein